MKKVVTLFLVIYASASFSAMWMLVKSDFIVDMNGGSWICTYQISGGQYVKTIESKGGCAQFIGS